MRRNLRTLLFVLCALATIASAQVVITSNVVGSITDPQGAVLPDTKITLTNVDTGVQWKQTTNASGDYQFTKLIAGHYKVEAIKEGFSHTVSTAVALENGTTLRINLGLKLGKTIETVEVSGATSLVKTDDANVSEVIENKFVRDLPMEGRNYLNFAQILPNFNTGTGDTSRMAWGLASATMPGAMQLNVGGTEYGVGYYVDGLNNNDNWVEGPLVNVNLDTIQEVKAEVSNYSAEYGRDVGQISVTSKSGTNTLHGSVYDTLQNSGMNANNPYSNFQDIPRNAFHQNQYGFTVGGPVIIPKVFNGKNKLFFFASFERLRNRGETQFTSYVPTTAERSGDFSDWLTRFPVDPTQCDGSANEPANCRYVIYDPSTLNLSTSLRQPFQYNGVYNVINPSLVATQAQTYLSHFPQPNGYSSPQADNFNNYAGSYSAGIDNNNYSARGDYNIGSRDSVYFRYLHDSGSVINQCCLLPELSMNSGPYHRSNTYQAHYVHSFSATFNNEFNVSWYNGYNFSDDPSQASAFASSWVPSLFQNSSSNMAGFTSYDKNLFNISNDATFSVSLGGNLPSSPGNPMGSALNLGATEYWYQWVPVFQLSDNVAKTIGRHTLKAGFYMARRYERDNDIIRSVNFNGNYTSKGSYINDGSGNGVADFELGDVSAMGQRTPVASGDASLYYGMPEYSAFFGDNWNATRNLTVTLGLRYDLPIPAYSVDNYWSVLDQTYPGWRFVMPGLTPGTSAHPFSADKNNFAPRLGLAYRLGEKTVIRSGYGIFYETGRFKFLDQVTWNGPGYGGTSYYSTSAPGVTDPGQTYYTFANTFQAPVTVTRGTYPTPLGTDGGVMWPIGGAYPTSTVDPKTWITPYSQRWSLDVQRELGKTVVATLGYVGSEGTHLPIQYDLNLYPQGFYPDIYTSQCLTCDAARPQTAVAPGRWSGINSVRPNQSNNYNAMNAQLKMRGWHGLTSQVSYTWSKQMDTFFGESGEGGQHAIGGQWHPNWSYGPSDANHTNRFVAALTYELPGANLIANRWARELIGGWQVNSITTFESGAPTTIYNGYTQSYDGMGDVPLQTCNANLSHGSKTFTNAFNTNCYVEPAASTDPYYTNQGISNYAVTRGNERRNNVTQPGINNWDMGLQKSFRVFGEGRELQFRADAFNAFNHTQWLNFYNGCGNTCVLDDRQTNAQSEFGFIQAGRPGRRMQLNMRFVF
jgi:hypothetical protein